MPDAIVVVDTEFTAWEGSVARGWSGPQERREIVQIGAVRLDAALRETGHLTVLVRPRHNALLSEYFVGLTGIEQDRLDRDGLPFAVAYRTLARFARGAAAIYANGRDDLVIAENLAINELPAADHVRLTDIRGWLARMLSGPRDGIDSHRIAALVGAPAAGGPHDALADARGVAAGIRYACQEREGVLPVGIGSAR